MKKRNATFSVTIFIFGVVFSINAGYMLKEYQKRNQILEFENRMMGIRAGLKLAIGANIESLYGLSTLFRHDDLPSLEAFRQVAKPILSRNPSIKALEWVPLIENHERLHYERLMQVSHPEFEFTSRSDEGELQVSPQKDVYFPVYYIEPVIGNEAALGFDLYSNKARRDTLLKARETGLPSATKGITLVQDSGEYKGFLVFVPIYKQENTTVMARSASLTGYTVGVYKINELVTAATQLSDNIKLNLIDVTYSQEELVFTNFESSTQVWLNDFTYRSEVIHLLGRQWRVEGVPSENFFGKDDCYYVNSIVFGGILLSAVLSYLLYVLRRRNYQVELKVKEKTKELVLINQKLEQLSNLDGLTGIANRRVFDTKLEELWQLSIHSRQNVAVIVIDIDNFKVYNDTYGHLEGDKCLKAVAEVLARVPTKESDLVARYGGEEFVFLLFDCAEPLKVAQRCQEAIKRIRVNFGSVVESSITVSIGVSVTIASGTMSPYQLFKAADIGVYRAKRNGKDQIQYVEIEEADALDIVPERCCSSEA